MKYSLTAAVGFALLLSGCFGGSGSGVSGTLVDPPVVIQPNGKPTIAGSPPTQLRVGEVYEFTPIASDPDGDALSFSIANKPHWASFDATTGRLAGTPQEADVGMNDNIGISVSDGKDQTALQRFSITVNQIATGSATLSWQPPTKNSDGTTLTDLSGYKIYYGRDASGLDQIVTLDNPGLTLYVIENLSPATWYFEMTSYNSQGVESDHSSTASKIIG